MVACNDGEWCAQATQRYATRTAYRPHCEGVLGPGGAPQAALRAPPPLPSERHRSGRCVAASHYVSCFSRSVSIPTCTWHGALAQAPNATSGWPARTISPHATRRAAVRAVVPCASLQWKRTMGCAHHLYASPTHRLRTAATRQRAHRLTRTDYTTTTSDVCCTIVRACALRVPYVRPPHTALAALSWCTPSLHHLAYLRIRRSSMEQRSIRAAAVIATPRAARGSASNNQRLDWAPSIIGTRGH